MNAKNISSSTDEFDQSLFFHSSIWTPEAIQRTVTLVSIMTLTLCGNVIIIVLLTRSRYRTLHRRVNIFIINLAIGDLAVCCFTMTTEVLFVLFDKNWVIGESACKVLVYIEIVTLASTTFILTSMSIDRYMVVCKPHIFSIIDRRATVMVACSWIMALIFAVPQLFIFKQVAVGNFTSGEIQYTCASRGYTAWWQRKTYFSFLTGYILVIPSIIITFCYFNVVTTVWRQSKKLASGRLQMTNQIRTSKRDGLRVTVTKQSQLISLAKVQTIKLTLCIICSFIVCWTPYFIVHLIHIWSEYTYDIPVSVVALADTMALVNSAVNPLIYGYFNINLKRDFRGLPCSRCLTSSNQL